MRHSDILKLVRAETDKRPDAFTDFLDALTLSANNISEHFADKRDQMAAQRWLRIASEIDRVRSVVQREVGG